MPTTPAALALLILAGPASPPPARIASPLEVTVNADGSFTPPTIRIHDGDTVTWILHDRTDAVVQSSAQASFAEWTTCLPKPWEPADVNNLAGPMPEGASGLFVAAPYGNDAGFEVASGDCADPDAEVAASPSANPDGTYDHLCATGRPGATMAETWRSDDVTGVHIRLLWNQIQPEPDRFDFEDLARELESAVSHGKLYSLSIKAGRYGTPDWIFSTDVDPETGRFVSRRHPGPVTRLAFRDGGEDADGCGWLMYLGNPTERAYRELWGAMVTEVARFVKSRADWYRALAYTRLSGANLLSAENRLPDHCKAECGLCNTEVWAKAGYTPSGLYAFYEWQEDLLADLFPGKPMTYQLIQAGFPRVSDTGCWMVGEDDEADTVCPYPGPALGQVLYRTIEGTDLLPGGTEQTSEIIDRGIDRHGPLFHVQHNGLGVEPTPGTCPNYQLHPAAPPAGDDYASSGTGCPNHWVLEAGARTPVGQLTGFQTQNATGGVDGPAALDSTFVNAWENSDAAYLEIYEQRHWEAQRYERAGVGQASGHTMAEWTEKLHRRRRNQLVTATTVADPFPETYSYTFHHSPDAVGDETIYYYNAGKCGPGNPRTGVVVVEPAPGP